MKKIYLLIAAAIVLSCSAVNAQAVTNDLEEDFSTDVETWGFSAASGHTYSTTAATKTFTINYGTSNRVVGTKSLETAIYPSEIDNKMTIETIVTVASLGSNENKAVFYYLDSAGKPLFGWGIGRHGGGSGTGWKIVRLRSYDLFSVRTNNYGGADVLNVNNTTAKITAVLDFDTQTFSYTATDGTFNAETGEFVANATTISSSDNVFLSKVTDDGTTIAEDPELPDAINLGKFETTVYRARGSNSTALRYVGVATLKNVSTADVTVKFKDQDDNYFKTEELIADEIVGETYVATSEQKASYSADGYYYALDTSSPTSIVVGSEGSTLELLFKKSTFTSGLYEWTGIANSNWSELDENFDVSSVALAYQNGNAVSFAEAMNKTVTVSGALDLESENATVTTDGYIFEGTGSLTGSGKFVVNLSDNSDVATFNLTNNLTDGIEVQKGTAYITGAASALKYTLADGSKLAWDVAGSMELTEGVKMPVVGTGTVSIDMLSNVAYNAAITGASTLNIALGSSENTSGTVSYNLGGTTFPSGAQINVNNGADGATIRANITRNALTNSKLNVGQDVIAGRFDGYGDLYTIGELSGLGILEGANHTSEASNRVTKFQVGSLNTDATFAGTIRQYNSSGSNNSVNFEKVGTGTLTFSGNNESTKGSFAVKAGTLILDGSIVNENVAVSVDAEATLAGTGSIAGTATINGTLEGSLTIAILKGNGTVANAMTVNGVLDATDSYLTFDDDVTLAGTMNIKADTDKAVIVTGDLVRGGTLNVTVDEDPDSTTDIQLIEVDENNVSGSFATVNLPEAQEGDSYSLVNKEDGIYLHFYKFSTGTDNVQIAKEVLRVEYIDLTGRMVSQHENGFLIRKVIYTDGSATTEKVIVTTRN
jgi:autotransporter-associated beta strand protein